MKAIKVTEASFSNNESVDFSKDKTLMVIVNLISIGSFVFFYFLFYYLAKLFSITSSNDFFFYIKSYSVLPYIDNLIFLAIILLVLVIHELIHGLFFYLFTGEKPVYGYKFLYAYAGAPHWYVKKNYFYAVSLSPFLIITATGFIALSLAPAAFSSIIFLTFTANAAGCIGDFWISIKLLSKPAETYINDLGTNAVISYN